MRANRTAVLDRLLQSEEPSIRFKALVHIAGENPQSRKIKSLQEEIRTSSRVKTLLAGREQKFVREDDVYAVPRPIGRSPLSPILDILPATRLIPMRDQLLDRWLSKCFYTELESTAASRSLEATRVYP